MATWRKLNSLTSEEAAQKAATSRSTISRIENGDPSVSFATIFNICSCMGILESVIDAMDPYETELGRARADQALPQRVRSSRR